ncbi:MAG: hypothetical protein KGI69_01115 [Patescibacteria group bacterium]|nr:hypothetical protein [Patescibacteria group bacterium]
MRNILICAAAAASLAATGAARAADPSGSATNGLSAATAWADMFIDKKDDGLGTSLTAAYGGQLETRGAQIFADRLLSPGAAMDIARSARRGYSFNESVVSLGRGGFESSFEDALRETAVARLPIDRWESYGEDTAQGFFGKLLGGSLGNTVEQRTPTVSADATFAAEEERRSTIAQAESDGRFSYGIRFWDAYAYARTVFGHIQGKPATLLVRLKADTGLSRLGTPSVETAVSVPIYDDCRLVIGSSVHPTEVSSKDMSPSISVRIEHATGISKVFWYGGGQSGPGETLYSAGLSFHW